VIATSSGEETLYLPARKRAKTSSRTLSMERSLNQYESCL
jgi:hypothetical protein